MNVVELIIGLLGGGVVSQMVQALVNRRAAGRQMNANALSTEVEAMSQTIKLLRESMEEEIRNHAAEREALLREVRRLHRRVNALTEALHRLRAHNAQFTMHNS